MWHAAARLPVSVDKHYCLATYPESFPWSAGLLSLPICSGKDLLPTFVKYIGATGPEGFKQMTALRSVLEELNGHFKSHGRFINGSEITAGDCVVAPLLYQVEIVCNQLKVCALLCQAIV